MIKKADMDPSGDSGPVTAIWALTARGVALALSLAGRMGNCDLHVPDHGDLMAEAGDFPGTVRVFSSLKQEVAEKFHQYRAHVFFMATGIVVRVIAPCIVHKTHDPAVVVVDDLGTFAISLLSGHIGGANDLARDVAAAIGATPVITTATDVNQLPSVDTMAVQKNLVIENPEAIKQVNMAFLTGKPVGLVDPYGIFRNRDVFDRSDLHEVRVCIDDRLATPQTSDLILRPKILVAGIGCNRGTAVDEIRDLLYKTLEHHGLSHRSLGGLASVDLKDDEPALHELADELGLTLVFFSRDMLKTVENIKTPSLMVEKHIGVKSVCEAAAIRGANMGTLVVPKQKTANATVAVARMSCTL